MPACTLSIGPRVVLVADGPPVAEFALFDAADVELAQTEPGVVREAGYRTTAAEALRRLAVAGVTPELAEEAASSLRARVAQAYARGPVARAVASLLGAAELFDGGRYDATLRRYEGTFLELALLANDAGIGSGTAHLQALALVAQLAEVARDATVALSTLGHAEAARLGERTMRRRAIEGANLVPRALRTLGDRPPSGALGAGGPSRDDVAALVRERIEGCVSLPSREHLQRLERALSERPRPTQGPLADPELWSLDRQLAQGNAAFVIERLDAREAASGREPGTIYLRARASLQIGQESPRAIAQRVSELASSMFDFPELHLIAAQAWDAAGETRRALPFARDLLSNQRAPEELRAAAEALLRAPRNPLEPSQGSRDFEASSSGDLEPMSQVPMSRVPPSPRRPSEYPPPSPRVGPSSVPVPATVGLARRSEPPAQVRRSQPPPAPQVDLAMPPPPIDFGLPPPPRRSSAPPPDQFDPHEAPTPRTLTPPDAPALGRPSERRSLTPPERIASPLPPRSAKSAPPRFLDLPPPSSLPRSQGPLAAPRSQPPLSQPRSQPSPPPASPQPSAPPRSISPGRVVQPTGWPAKMPAPREENIAPQEIEHTPVGSRAAARYMRGASMPPVALEPPSPTMPRAPVVPRVDIDEPELVETLALPRGATEAAIDPNVVPRTPLEARVRFTLDARELARRYRHEHHVDLRVDARTIVSVERHLADRFPARTITSSEEAREAELHGALLSELLARMLDAEWVDLTPTELGYWAMVIPTRDGSGKRVWPFGRILRFIASGGQDDLTGFFRKLRDLG